MLGIARQWCLKTERGPDCLFVRIDGQPRGETSNEELVDMLRTLLDQHFVNRLILECDQLSSLSESMIRDLSNFAEQLSASGGQFRLTGLRPAVRAALDQQNSDSCLPVFVDRAHALMGRHSK